MNSMGFSVIDRRTNDYPRTDEIALTEEWAKNLIYCDIEGFYIGEDGALILVDDCGNTAYCPPDRFDVVFDDPARVSEWAKAEAEGRLVVLPCKSGDVIYQLRGKKHANGAGVAPRRVSCVSVWGDGSYSVHHQGMTPCTSRDFGKTWFLTKNEAEVALAAEGEQDD